jgi:hypothetical protein
MVADPVRAGRYANTHTFWISRAFKLNWITESTYFRLPQ